MIHVGVLTPPPVDSIPTEGAESEDLYRRICADARRARVYGQWAGDVAHTAFLIAQKRGYYYYAMMREAARNIGMWKEASTQPLSEQACHDDIASVKAWKQSQRIEAQRERIFDALSYAPQKVRQAAILVLQGWDMQSAAAVHGMSPSAFSEALRAAGKKLQANKIRINNHYSLKKGDNPWISKKSLISSI